MSGVEALVMQAKLLWDGDAADKGMSNAGKSAEKMESKIGGALKKIGGYVAAAFTVDAIKNFAVACIESGAEVSAETAAFGQIMGDYADEANKKMQAIADETGMVSTRLTPYMTSMTAKFKGLGFDIDDATTMASRGLNLAADSAAFWDMSLDESMGHLNSFINGSYEGGEAIGLFANDTQMAAYAVEKGIVKNTKKWANLDEATKQATRLEYAENMMKQSGATGQAAKESGAYANVMANLAEKWRQFKAQIGEPLIENVVTPAVDLLGKGLDKLSEIVQYSIDHFKDWKPYIIAVADAIVVLAAGFAGFQIGSAISKAVTFIKQGQIWTKAWAAAQKVFNIVMNANPVGLVVMAITALVAAFVLAYQKSETFRNFVNNLWASLKEKLQPVLQTVGEFIQTKVVPAFQQMGDFIQTRIVPVFQQMGEFIQTRIVPALQELGSWLQEHILSAIQAVGDWISTQLIPKLTEWWNYIKLNIVPALQELGAAIQERVQPILNWLSDFITTTVIPIFQRLKDNASQIWQAMAPALEAAKTAWSTIWTNIKTVAQTVWTNIQTIVQTGLQVIKGIIQTVTSLIRGDWSGAWTSIKNTASILWNGIKTVVSNSIQAAKTVISNTLAGIRTVWSNIWTAIKNTASTIWNSIKDLVIERIEKTQTQIKENVEKIKNWMNFDGLKAKAEQVFKDTKDAIVGKIEDARDKIKEIIDKIKGFFTGAKFEWPDIPTPHFSISPKGWKIGDLLEGSIPKLSIDWYARAMDQAAVLDGATIFGAAGGHLLGGGEAGREVVSGEAHLIGLINQAVAQNNAALLEALLKILDAIQRLDAGLYDQLVEALVDGVKLKWDNREFGRLVKAHA